MSKFGIKFVKSCDGSGKLLEVLVKGVIKEILTKPRIFDFVNLTRISS